MDGVTLSYFIIMLVQLFSWPQFFNSQHYQFNRFHECSFLRSHRH